MSVFRRTTLTVALAGGLLTAGLLPLTMASAASCAAWTDPEGDATTGQSGAGPLADPQLDIVSAAFGTVGSDVVAVIGSSSLGESSSDAGDEFRMDFTVAGVRMTAYADRTAPEGVVLNEGAGFLNNDDDAAPVGEATATYDLEAGTVTIRGSVAALAEAVAKPVVGEKVTDLSAETSDVALLLPAFDYDDAPTDLTPVIGTACTLGGAPAAGASATPSAGVSPSASAAPSASASPSTGASPSASATPSGSAAPAPGAAPGGGAGQPRPGCTTQSDPVGDAVIPFGGPGIDEPDLDITGLVLESTPTTTRAFVQVDELAAAPNAGVGHVFTTLFTLGESAVQLVAQQYDGPLPTASRLVVNATTVPSSLTAEFDVERSQVVVSIPTSELAAAVPGFAPGRTLTAVFARSGSLTPAVTLNADNTNPDNAAAPAATQVWVVGDNACFAPPAARVSRTGAVTAQFGDVVGAAVKLVDSKGAPLAGKRVSVNLGAATSTVTTGKDGTAKVRVPVRLKAGRAVLTTSFAGDATAGAVAVRSPFTVTVERTALTATGGTGAVTARLLDDDRNVVAGQVVRFTAGGVERSVRTDARGVARATGLPAGSTVTVAYAGAAGQYAASRTTATA